MHESEGVQSKCIHVANNSTKPRTTHFSKKNERWDSNPQHSGILGSALLTELPGQLSRQDSKSTTQGKGKPQIIHVQAPVKYYDIKTEYGGGCEVE